MKTPRLFIIGALALVAVAVSSCTPSASENPLGAPTVPPAATTTPVNSPPVPVSLTSYFNNQGIYPDGASFSSGGGIDGDGFACSSNFLGTVQTCNGVPFQLGSAINSSNVIACAGQTIALPPGNFSKLQMLAIAVNGAQADQPFTVTYADNSTHAFTQSLSDWAQPDSNGGESQAVTMDYRDQFDGTKDENAYYLYSYSFDLSPTNGVQSLKLPDNDNVKVFALTLVP